MKNGKYCVYLCLCLGLSLVMGVFSCNSGGGGGGSPTAPVIAALSPNSGLSSGGYTITITGERFSYPNVTVYIAGTAATLVADTSNSSTQLMVTAPGGNPGTVVVEVINNDAQSDTENFTYTSAPIPAPTITSVSPTSVFYSEQTSVYITGTNFRAGARVTFTAVGSSTAKEATIDWSNSNTSQLVVTNPTATGAERDIITVINPDNQLATYTYFEYVNERWYRTKLNAPNTSKPIVFNNLMMPLYLRGGHQAVWTGQTGDLPNVMLVWGRNTSRISRDAGPLFATPAATCFPDMENSGTNKLAYVGGIYSAIGSDLGRFDSGVTVTMLCNNKTIVIAGPFKTASRLEVKIPDPGSNFTLPAQLQATNPDGQYDISPTFYVAPGSRHSEVLPMLDRTGRVAAGGYNIGAYLKLGADASSDKWTEISVTNAPTRRNGFSAVWTGKLFIVWGGFDDRGVPEFFNDGGRYNPATGLWTSISTTDAPEARAGHSALWTSERMLVWGGHNAKTSFSTGGLYNPATDTWSAFDAQEALQARSHHSAVEWTGTTSILWGGLDNPPTPAQKVPPAVLQDGAFFTVLISGGTETIVCEHISKALTNTPSARYRHTAAWTGKYMVVWGGCDQYDPSATTDFLSTGAAFEPLGRTWTTIVDPGAANGRAHHTAVYLRPNYMVVYGGTQNYTGTELIDGIPQPIPLLNGLLLDTTGLPGAWTWAAIAPPDATTRLGHSAVVVNTWPTTATDTMVMWGGDGIPANPYGGSGYLYDPASNNWTRATGIGNSPPRGNHTAVLTNDNPPRMIVWGGRDYSIELNRFNSGAIYQPPTAVPVTSALEDMWYKTEATTNVPAVRDAHTAIWTGSNMIIWGGTHIASALNDGAIFTPPAANSGGGSWTATATTDLEPRLRHTAVWTGTYMIVWGGCGFNGATYQTGGQYTPGGGWVRTSILGLVPAPRFAHTAVWNAAGNEMIVWGGQAGNADGLNNGGRFIPDAAGGSWTTLAVTGTTPTARFSHTAVWTGSQMIVWGGEDKSSVFQSGGIYTPDSSGGTWIATAIDANTPSPRYGHTAVWTGSQMLVWGGVSATGTRLNNGALYTPSSSGGSWTPITSGGAPSPRYAHTAVWISTAPARMVVFGGFNEDFLASGGVYFPQAGRWYLFGED